MSDNLTAGLMAVGVIVAVALLAAIWRWRPQRGEERAPRRYQVARIEEFSVATSGGTVATIILVLHNFGMLAFFVETTNGAIQQAALGTIWIAGNVLWGTCVIVGRKRTYVVTREAQPPNDPPMA